MTMRHAAGGAGDLDDRKRSPEDDLQAEGRPDRDDGPDGGAPPVIKGTSLAGPTGGTIVAATDGSLDPTMDPDPDRTFHEEDEEPR